MRAEAPEKKRSAATFAVDRSMRGANCKGGAYNRWSFSALRAGRTAVFLTLEKMAAYTRCTTRMTCPTALVSLLHGDELHGTRLFPFEPELTKEQVHG